MINYSIIIPHKNIPEQLERCLNSIPKSNDIQIIIIDDKSSEENIKKLKIIELKYKNIEILYTSQEKGAGFARNIGLDKAQGKWIIFADADDTFSEDLQKQLDVYKDNNNDIIKFYYTRRIFDYCTDVEYKILNINQPQKVLDGTVWGRFIRKDFINKYKIKCQETIWGNDTFFSFALEFYSKNIVESNISIYNYYLRHNSLSTIPTQDSCICRIKNIKSICDLYKKDNRLINIQRQLVLQWKTLYRINKIKSVFILPYVIKNIKLNIFIENISLLREIKNCIKYPRYLLGKIKKKLINKNSY